MSLDITIIVSMALILLISMINRTARSSDQITAKQTPEIVIMTLDEYLQSREDQEKYH